MSCNFLFPCCADESSRKRRNKRAEKLAASAFQSLEPEEQDRVYRDLYGTEEPVEETPDFLKSKFDELDRELNMLSENATKYYNRAVTIERQQKGSSYVSSPKFRLMFLRADRFDTKMAARRLASYLHEKFFLFGEEGLTRKIKQEDFNNNDMKALLSGAICFTGELDMAGRPLLLVRREMHMKHDITSLKRAAFYIFQNMLEDNDEAQQKGVVVILDNKNSAVSYVGSQARRYLALPRLVHHSFPCRIVGVQNFYDDLKEYFVINFTLAVYSKDMRARYQGHYNLTFEECMYTLQEYGILLSDIPLAADGKLRHEALRSYWERQRQLEC